ncbi:MAG TPA: endonuclease III [Dehalococcoidia bacterium]|jgi:endonuclease-3|nr:endonuclease III [Dehalococcoidia bacterium]
MTGIKNGPKTKKLKVKAVSDLLSDIYGSIPWKPRYNAAEELVYTILSQHTSDINSERAFHNILAVFGDLDHIADADVDDIEVAIRRGGLSKTKAPRIKSILNEIREELGSFDLSFLAEMPLQEAKAWLINLKGVGPKTAAIILCFSFGMPAMPVDTHIYRVAQRLSLVGKKISAEKAHDILESLVAPEEVFQFHMYLIKHGRDTCKAQNPKCNQCSLTELCPSFKRYQ